MRVIWTPEKAEEKNKEGRRPDFEFMGKFCNYVTERGIYINEERANHYISDLEGQMLTIKNVLAEYGHADLNPNSPVQVSEYFFNNYSEELLKKYFYVYNARKREMSYSFGRDLVLEFNKFAHDPIAKSITSYTSVGRRITTLKKLLHFQDKHNLVHPSYEPAVTNRVYSKEPYIEDFDIETYKGLFTPEGWGIIELDYRQIEPRLATYIFEISEFLKFTHSEDFYTTAASQILGLDALSVEQRDEFKACWNAVTYGASRGKISKMAKNIDGNSVYDIFYNNETVQETWRILDNNRDAVVYTMFDTPLLEENRRNYYSNNRVKVAWIVQGSAADVLALAVEDVYLALQEKGYEGYDIINAGYYNFKSPIQVYYTSHDAIRFIYNKSVFSELEINRLVEELRSEITYYINEDVLLPLKISQL